MLFSVGHGVVRSLPASILPTSVLKNQDRSGRGGGLTERRRADGPDDGSGIMALCRRRALPPTLPFTTGHLIAGRARVLVKTTGRTTVKRLARRKYECLPIAKSLYFYFFYYTISISRPRDGVRGRWPGHSRRDIDAGTNVTKLLGHTSYINSHSQMPG